MSTPQKPDEPPADDKTSPHDPNGVPGEIDGGEAKGHPTSDRAKSEEAAKE